MALTTWAGSRNHEGLLRKMRNSKTIMRVFGLTALLVILWTTALCAQKMVVPVKLQLAILLKALTYDRHLKEKADGEILVAICYHQEQKQSVEVKDELLEATKASLDSIENIPLRFTSVDMQKDDLAAVITRQGVDILYVTPLSSAVAESITAVSREKKTTTVTGVPDYIKSGVAVAIGIKGDKPQIIINLPAAKAEGADFSSELLKLAKVIQ